MLMCVQVRGRQLAQLPLGSMQLAVNRVIFMKFSQEAIKWKPSHGSHRKRQWPRRDLNRAKARAEQERFRAYKAATGAPPAA